MLERTNFVKGNDVFHLYEHQTWSSTNPLISLFVSSLPSFISFLRAKYKDRNIIAVSIFYPPNEWKFPKSWIMFNNLPRYSFTPKVKNVNYFDESFGLACITMRQRILKHILMEASKFKNIPPRSIQPNYLILSQTSIELLWWQV